MNGQDAFLWGLQINDSLTTELTAKMTFIALGVAVICFICNIAYNYLFHGVSQLLTSDENKFPDLMEIARCLALLFCLSLYTPIVKTIVGTLEIINRETSLSDLRKSEFAAYLEKAAGDQHKMLGKYHETSLEANIKAGEDKDGAMAKEQENMRQGNQTDESASTLKQIFQLMNPTNFAAMLVHSLAAALVGIIQLIIQGIGVVIVKILVILGPFVFAFSILPVFQKQLSNWFGILCCVGMAFTVINVLNQIMWFSFRSIFNTETFNLGDEATKQVQYLAMDLAIIGAYCSSFWLAGKIVGHGDAGRIISKTVSIVTAAATMAIAGPAIAGGATNVGAAASLGKSIIDDEKQ